MKNRRPTSMFTNATYDVKAKNLRKGDSVWIGSRTYRVKSNQKNAEGLRVISLRWGTKKAKDDVVLVIRGKVPFKVREIRHIRNSGLR